MIITPEVDIKRTQDIKLFRASAFNKNGRFYGTSLSPCGIVWSLAAFNGSETNFTALKNYKNGQGWYRIMNIVYEIFSSASRVKKTIQMSGNNYPKICRNRKPDLALFMDRGLLLNVSKSDSLLDTVICLFDQIFYFDEFPGIENIMATKSFVSNDSIIRLSPRSMTTKMISFLLSPYDYTIYLDGDTSPCEKFHIESFQSLASIDIFTTENVFGYQGTNENPLYPNAPDHPTYMNYTEPNAGIIGFKKSTKNLEWIIRSIELIPYLSSMGYFLDQVFMRHAIFESVIQNGLIESRKSMDQYCRHAWNCDRNRCPNNNDKNPLGGCLIIHSRSCLHHGVSTTFSPQEIKCTNISNQYLLFLPQKAHLYEKLFIKAYRSNQKYKKLEIVKDRSVLS